jgi:hypothetical protein
MCVCACARAGIRLLSGGQGGGGGGGDPAARAMSAAAPRKKIGDLTQAHRRGSMLRLEKSWDTQHVKKKPNSRKSFGNVFAAAAAEDEQRAELEHRILQGAFSPPGVGGGSNGGGGGSSSGWIGGPPDGPGSPPPGDAARKVLESFKAYVANHGIPLKDVHFEFKRTFPHGELGDIGDVRTAVKIIGRSQISSADIHAIVKYLDSLGQWRGDGKMRWADIVDFL